MLYLVNWDAITIDSWWLFNEFIRILAGGMLEG